MLRPMPDLDAHFVRWGAGGPADAKVGAKWLRRQPGTPIVFVSVKKHYQDSLAGLLPDVQMVAARGGGGYIGDGPVLVAWPDEEMIAQVSGEHSGRRASVCVLEWGENRSVRAWLSRYRAVDVLTGEPFTDGDVTLAPLVLVAMRNLNEMVNHSNGLNGSYDGGLAIKTLTELVRLGQQFEVDDICAWAVANGFTATEVGHLRDYAEKALRRHNFRPNKWHRWEHLADAWQRELKEEGTAGQTAGSPT